MNGSSGVQILYQLLSWVAAVDIESPTHYFHGWQQWDSNPAAIHFMGCSSGIQLCTNYFLGWQQWDPNPAAFDFISGSYEIQILYQFLYRRPQWGPNPAHFVSSSNEVQILYPLSSWVEAIKSKFCTIFIGGSSGIQIMHPMFSRVSGVGSKSCRAIHFSVAIKSKILYPFLRMAVVGSKSCSNYCHGWQQWDSNPAPNIFMGGSSGIQILQSLISLVAAHGCLSPCYSTHY